MLSAELTRLFDEHAQALAALDRHWEELRLRGVGDKAAEAPEAARAADRAWMDHYLELERAENEAAARLLGAWDRRAFE
jgi:hypothetical protein